MTSVLALATLLFKLAPDIFATLQAAIEAAKRFTDLMNGEHIDPAALDGLIADIKANSDIIQRPITE